MPTSAVSVPLAEHADEEQVPAANVLDVSPQTLPTHLQDMAENAAENATEATDNASEGIEITDADEAEQVLSATLAAFTEADEKEIADEYHDTFFSDFILEFTEVYPIEQNVNLFAPDLAHPAITIAAPRKYDGPPVSLEAYLASRQAKLG